MTTPEAIATLRAMPAPTLLDQQAVAEAVAALSRIEAIRKAHEAHATVTDGGKVVHPAIHGHHLNELLYGAINVD
jgi:hypothetical protein